MPTAITNEAMPLDGRNNNGKTNSWNDKLKALPGARYKYKKPSKWKRHHFICFDGEGYDVDGRHEYVYLAAYDSMDIFSVTEPKGLGSEQCFEFLVEVASTDKMGICVIYGGSYDSNMMMRDIPKGTLFRLYKTGKARWGDWHLRYAQRKYLQVHHIPTKRTCQLWDVIGFFQSSFQVSLGTWLGVTDDVIAKGKQSRGKFQAKSLETFIIPYCNTELQYFYDLMQALWLALDKAGFKLSRWDGAGSIASYLFSSHGMFAYKGSEEAQAEHYDKARSAYAGGRFELLRPGDYRQTVYNYDINSAYPYAICQLPPFQELEPIADIKSHTLSDYDLCYIVYDNRGSMFESLGTMPETFTRETVRAATASKPGPIHPFFHRSANKTVCYPPQVARWAWGVEVNTARRCGFHVEVTEVLHWHDTGERPWSWVAQLYNHRRVLKANNDSAEKAIKLGINSLYGKMVQQKGWHVGEDIPKTHQLYWGGWVTTKTRSMIFEAMMQAPDAIIAVETDGIYTTKKLALPVSPNLGDWDMTVYEDFTYCQSGMYFGTTMDAKAISKYRGLDKGTLTRDKVLAAYETYQTDKSSGLRVQARSTRFRTLGTSLASDERMAQWRQWTKETKTVKLEPANTDNNAGKRYHHPFCREPYGVGHSHHTLPRPAKDMESVPYNVLWIDTADKEQYFLELDEEREGIIVDL